MTTSREEGRMKGLFGATLKDYRENRAALTREALAAYLVAEPPYAGMDAEKIGERIENLEKGRSGKSRKALDPDECAAIERVLGDAAGVRLRGVLWAKYLEARSEPAVWEWVQQEIEQARRAEGSLTPDESTLITMLRGLRKLGDPDGADKAAAGMIELCKIELEEIGFRPSPNELTLGQAVGVLRGLPLPSIRGALAAFKATVQAIAGAEARSGGLFFRPTLAKQPSASPSSDPTADTTIARRGEGLVADLAKRAAARALSAAVEARQAASRAAASANRADEIEPDPAWETHASTCASRAWATVAADEARNAAARSIGIAADAAAATIPDMAGRMASRAAAEAALSRAWEDVASTAADDADMFAGIGQEVARLQRQIAEAKTAKPGPGRDKRIANLAARIDALLGREPDAPTPDAGNRE